MYNLPQEIEVWYVIPAIRREMATCLSKEYNISYDKIAKLMGLTKTAISMYVSRKRAEKIKIHPKALKKIIISCENIVNKNIKINAEIIKTLNFIKKNKLHCEKCGRMVNGIFHKCREVKIPEINLN